MSSIYDPVDSDLEAFQNKYIMSPELWEKFNFEGMAPIDFSKWKTIKLMNDDGNAFSNELNRIPTKYGGIYVYTIEPGIIPGCGSYIMYIGMASKTPHENLRARVKSYQKEIGDDFSRDRIHRLFKKWGKYVYVHYLPVEKGRDTILELETRLIAVILPPCNSDIQAKSVKHAVRAFT